MKNLILLCFFCIFNYVALSQDITISFNTKSDTVAIDSIHVLNLRTNQTVKLSGGQNLILVSTSTSLDVLPSVNNNLIVYPNPTREHANLFLSLPASQNVVINLFNISGQLLLRESHSFHSGKHQFRVNFPVSGLYHVSVRTDNSLLNSKVLYFGEKTDFTEMKYIGSDFYDITKNQSKSANSELENNTLEFKPGDVIHYTVYSGENMTLISDIPSESTSVEVEFYKCTDRDGKNYKTVKIGDQTWMAENLAYLPSVRPPTHGSSSGIAPRYNVYDYQGTDVNAAKATNNYGNYGVLYNWPAAMDGLDSSSDNPSGVRGVCPAGWHLPSDAEWTQLENYLIFNGYNYDVTTIGDKIAKSLAANTLWDTSSNSGAVGNNLSANNSSGFSGLPGGRRYMHGGFGGVGFDGYWWSSAKVTLSRYLSYENSNLRRVADYIERGLSVRCVRDTEKKLSVETSVVSDITHTTATLNGNVTSDGGTAITSRGFYWSASNEKPGESDNVETAGIGLGEFSVTLSTLKPNTTYYYRAFATYAQGPSTGSVLSFKTQGGETSILTDSRDGNTYKTIKVGDQWWMAENLAYLPSVSPSSQGSNSAPYQYVYDYQGTDVAVAKATTNYSTYGVLYNWPGALQACPSSWHLPSDAEWTQLENYLADNGYNYDGTIGGGGAKIAKSLAANTTWVSSYYFTGAVGNNLYANNISDFSGLPAGSRNDNGSFNYFGDSGLWWCSTEYSATTAWTRGLYYYFSYVTRSDFGKNRGFSVRCVRDIEEKLSVETSVVIYITQTSAILNGNVIYDGGTAITSRGFYWSISSEEPGESDNVETAGVGLGEFSVTLSNLQPNTSYFYRAFATNAQGTSKGSVFSFKTNEKQGGEIGTFTDSRDGNTYKTIKIGNQWWMAENLAYLPSVSPSFQGSATAPHYYVYDYQGIDVVAAKQHTNYTIYGVLYNWPAVIDGSGSSSANPSGVRGVCPAGWHLPSDAEWAQLENYLADNGYNYDGTNGGGRSKIAKSMAAITNWNLYSGTGVIGNNLSANNKSGFSALPGGFRGYYDGTFGFVGSYGYWWSSTEGSSSHAWSRGLYYYYANVLHGTNVRAYGFSVRCVRD